MLPGYGWRPPDRDVVKINTDAGISLEDRKGGGGGVARSHNAFLGAWSKPYDGVTDPLVAESLAVRDGIIFAKLRGYPKVILETDCLELVNLWNNRHGSRSAVAPILHELDDTPRVAAVTSTTKC
jgi:hypothetical protein